jgi:hypothetical protein
VIRTISQAALAAAMLTGTAEYAAAQPTEIMLRDATGYPNSSHTDGRLPMPGNSSGAGEVSYHVTAVALHCSAGTGVTRFAGVGYDLHSIPFNWHEIVWTLNVWQEDGSQSASELFEQSPKVGNVVSQLQLAATPDAYSGDDAYLTWLPAVPVELRAGSYLLSIRGYTLAAPGGTWNLRESDIDLGSDLYADSNAPGQSFEYTTDFGLPTGTSALDIWGYEITCIGDFNFDGVIDLSDLGTLLANFEVGDGMTYEQGDIDFDGDVDLSDLGAVLAVYEVPCD